MRDYNAMRGDVPTDLGPLDWYVCGLMRLAWHDLDAYLLYIDMGQRYMGAW